MLDLVLPRRLREIAAAAVVLMLMSPVVGSAQTTTREGNDPTSRISSLLGVTCQPTNVPLAFVRRRPSKMRRIASCSR